MSRSNGGPFYMNSSPVMTMVIQPGIQPPRNYGTIPMENRLWDRPPPGKMLTRRHEKSTRKIEVPKRKVAPALSDAACNTGRNSQTQTIVAPKIRTPQVSNRGSQTPRKRVIDRPQTAPKEKRRPPNPILGETNYSGGSGGNHGGGMSMRPASAGIKDYNTMDDKHLLDFYKKKYGLTKITKKFKEKGNLRTYKVRVETGGKKGAGTEARVFLTLFGSKGKSTKKRIFKFAGNGQQDTDLVPFKFSRGSAHTFAMSFKAVGVLEKILVEHDGYEESSSWFLNSISITPEDSPDTFVFNCEKWLSLYRGDCQISRELTPIRGKKLSKTKYEVIAITGDRVGAGTDANVFITIYGTRGQTEKTSLQSKTVDTFERGQSDVFIVGGVDIGQMKKIRIEQDGRGRGSDWFLERLVVTNQYRPNEKYYFFCGAWLNDKEGMFRDLIGSTDPNKAAALTNYVIKVHTGDFRGAGTDADVYINIFGDMGDTGQKFIDNRMQNNFERGKMDTFTLTLPSVGIVDKIRIGHNNKGPSPGWYLEKVELEVEGKGMEFICQRWFSKTEDDGKLEREFVLGGNASIFVHKVSIYTGDKLNSGTDANVWIQLFDEKGIDSGKIELNGKYERNDVDTISVELTDHYSPMKYIYIGHDNSGRGPGWYLDKVVIHSLSNGIEQTFDCAQWLEQTKSNTSQRKLTENKSKRREILEGQSWVAKIFTSDLRGSGTNANVFLQVYDVEGKRSQVLPLDNKTDNFESGQADRFTIDLPADFSDLYKIRIWHDGSRPFSGWHLDRIELARAGTDTSYEFFCGKWLATDEDDGEIVRELPATSTHLKSPGTVKDYKIIVKTGSSFGSGTDANVFLIVYGLGDTGKRPLEKSENRNKFEKGNSDEFLIKAVDLRDINHIQIGHDNWGGNAGWLLDSVDVVDCVTNITKTFICQRWLDERKDDGKLIRDLYIDGNEMLHTTRYTVRTKTSDILGAGTNANVSIQLFGEKNSSELVPLKLNENQIRDKFERSQVDIFHLEMPNVGVLERIKIGHDAQGLKSGWHLEYVEIEVPEIGMAYTFTCNRWFATDEDDELTWRELYPTSVDNRDGTIAYQIEVHTGDERWAGTNADVFIQIYGADKKKTEQKTLNDRSDNFERGSIDTFKLEDIDVGEISKIRIGHDDGGLQAGWNLHKVVISKKNGKNQIEKILFVCNKWFDKKKDDNQIVRELAPTDESGRPISDLALIDYTLVAVTGSERGAGTDANVFVTIVGEDGDSGERALTTSENRNKFEKEQEDTFQVQIMDLGEIKSIKVRHDGSGLKSGWFLDHIKLSATTLPEQLVFPCKRWLATDEDDGQIERALVAIPITQWKNKARNSMSLEQKAAIETYHVAVKTGDKMGAGTDANVYMQLFGEENDSGIIQLKASNNRNKWERDQIDEFTVESVGLGDLKKIRLGHDDKGLKAGWYVSHVEIDCPSLGTFWRFPVGKWFANDEEDGLVERDIYPDEGDKEEYTALVPYEFTISTSDTRGSGTNASVYVQLFGVDGTVSKKHILCSDRADRREKFESGNEDVFVAELCDVGEIEKLRIGHDDSGFKSGWHLNRVVVRTMNDAANFKSGSTEMVFPCNRWLASDEGDKRVEIDLLAAAAKLENKIYTINVVTGDKTGSGTDANVFLTLMGDNGQSPEFPLKDSETNRNKFERGQSDIFKVTTPDLGYVYKVQIRHDNSGLMGADWYLDHVEVTTDDAVEPSLFHCERWLSKQRRGKEGKLSRTLYVKGYDPEKMTSKSAMSVASTGSGRSIGSSSFDGPTTKYEVRIKTGTETGASSTSEPDAYIKFNGSDKSSKRINLNLPEDQDRFEKDGINSFTFENVDCGNIESIELGVRNQEESWYVNYLEVNLPLKAKTYVFQINNWYCKTEGDGLLTRTFDTIDALSIASGMRAKVPYEVTIFTGDEAEAGLESGDVYVTLCGETKNLTDLKISRDEASFGRGGRDTFTLDLENIEPIKMVTARVSSSSKSKWLCNKVEIRNLESGRTYIFTAADWIYGSGTIQLTSPNSNEQLVSYKVEVKTTDQFGGGTDANVSMQLTGQNGVSGQWALIKSETNEDPFERANSDMFTFDSRPDLGELTTCRIEHDDKGFKSGWHLEHVRITQGEHSWFFPCNQWLAKTEGDNQIMRELTPTGGTSQPKTSNTSYKISISTADVENASTRDNIRLKITGEDGEAELKLRNAIGLKRAETREFEPLVAKNVGVIQSVTVSLENTRLKDKCFMTVIELIAEGNTYIAPVDDWISIEPVRVMATLESGLGTRKRQNMAYTVSVVTSDERSAGTDANVKLTMYGSLGDSGKRPLEQRWRDLFERGQTDVFEVSCLDLGELERIRLEHDNKMLKPDWKPLKVVITCTNNEWTFPCGSWIGKKKGNGLEAEFRVAPKMA